MQHPIRRRVYVVARAATRSDAPWTIWAVRPQDVALLIARLGTAGQFERRKDAEAQLVAVAPGIRS